MSFTYSSQCTHFATYKSTSSSDPTTQPSRQPTVQPFGRPSRQPSSQPSRRPLVSLALCLLDSRHSNHLITNLVDPVECPLGIQQSLRHSDLITYRQHSRVYFPPINQPLILRSSPPASRRTNLRPLPVVRAVNHPDRHLAVQRVNPLAVLVASHLVNRPVCRAGSCRIVRRSSPRLSQLVDPRGSQRFTQPDNRRVVLLCNINVDHLTIPQLSLLASLRPTQAASVVTTVIATV